MAAPVKKPGRIYQRGSNWYVDIKNPDGSRYRRSVGQNRRLAERVLSNKRADLHEEEQDQSGDGPTVAACWRHYIQRIKAEGKPSTIITINTARKRWSALERKRVCNLTQIEIDTLVDNWPCAVTTKNASIKLLRAALRRAKRDGLLAHLPPVEFRERKHIVPLPLTLSAEEFRRLFSACKGYRAQTLVMVARFGGLRHSEVRHLVVSDIDSDKGVLLVTAKPEYGFSPKNYQERAVPLASVLATTLKAHIAAMPLAPNGSTDGSPDWLFPGEGVGPLAQVTTSGYVKAAYKAAGIGGDRPGMHRLRKTWATNMLKNCGLGVLMRLGGWNSLETVKRYIGTDDDAFRAAIDAQEF